MKSIVIILISLFAFVNLTKAQEASEQCLINISLMNESAKNRQYADAYTPWLAAYKECPQANRAIYTRGREILHWRIAQVKDDASYTETFNLLMEMYDNRIKYFGSDTRYPTAWILGLKGLDYISFAKNDELKEDAYKWLGESIDGMQEKSELEVLRQYVLLSSIIYKAKPTEHAEKFVADYLKTTALLDKQIDDPNNKNAELATQIRQGLDYVFVQSGVAECDTLDQIYLTKVNENIQNLDYLNRVMSFYRLVGCTESEVYFTAAAAAHEIKPTAESANGCAQMAYKKGDYVKAISYYEEATELEEDAIEKAEYQYKIAQIYYNELKNFSRSRQFARKSLEYNPNNGKAYILIGLMYANTKISDDSLEQKAVYWVAVDKFNRAKQVDSNPQIVQNANDLIRTYSAHFPTKEDIFFKPDWNLGESTRVGGWIEESTTVRASNN